MPSYMVSYDLRAPGRNYQPLYDALTNAKAVKALQSLWFLDDPKPSTQVRDILRGLVDANDGILVIEITNSNWATVQLLPGAVDWLKARFP